MRTLPFGQGHQTVRKRKHNRLRAARLRDFAHGVAWAFRRSFLTGRMVSMVEWRRPDECVFQRGSVNRSSFPSTVNKVSSGMSRAIKPSVYAPSRAPSVLFITVFAHSHTALRIVCGTSAT